MKAAASPHVGAVQGEVKAAFLPSPVAHARGVEEGKGQDGKSGNVCLGGGVFFLGICLLLRLELGTRKQDKTNDMVIVALWNM